MTVSSLSLQHPHDVKIIWELWPIANLLPAFVRDFLTGYGINPIFTWMSDVLWFPIWIWNGFWNTVIFPYTYFMFFLYTFLDWPYWATAGLIIKPIQFFIWYFRKLSGWIELENTVILLGLVITVLYLANEGGNLNLDPLFAAQDTVAPGTEIE